MSLKAINAFAAAAEMSNRANDFVGVAKMFAAARGDPMLAAKMAEARQAGPLVVSTLKAAVSPGTISDPTWAAPLSPYGGSIAAFLGSLRSVGAFDAMLPSMRQVPLRARVAVVTAGAVAGVAGDTSLRAISRLSLAQNTLAERLAVAIVIVSDEIARLVGPAASALFAAELRSAVAAVTDAEFIALVTDGIVGSAASGTTPAAIRTDFRTALASISTDSSSRIYVLMRSETAKSLSVAGNDVAAFPEMTPTGGVLFGSPALVSDGLAAGTIALIDANAVAADGGTVTLDQTRQASIQMDGSPDSPETAATTLVSLWQQGLVGVQVSRWFGAELLRPTGVGLITGAAY